MNAEYSNTALRNIRNAIALNHPNMVMVLFGELDEHLTTGGQLPTDWEDGWADGVECPRCPGAAITCSICNTAVTRR
jgi:hypothetical protein